jgi:flagellar motor protein MotB
MGRKDWHQMDSNDDLAAIGISPHRGRGWKILSGVLLVGTATFAAAYYLPLYRAHSSLSREYKTLQSQASAQRQQLTETLDALKQLSSERDRLSEIAGKLQATRNTLTPQAESLERDLQVPLKKFVSTGKLQIRRRSEKLSITFASPTFIAAAGAELTDAGKKAICLIGGVIKSADVHVDVKGYTAATPTKSGTGWQSALLRAGNVAQLLSESCGVDASRIEAHTGNPMPGPDGAAVMLEVTPR